MADQEEAGIGDLYRISEATQATRLMVANMASKLDVLAHSQAKMDTEQDSMLRRLNQFDVDRAMSISERKQTHDLAEATSVRLRDLETKMAVLAAAKDTTKQWAGTLNTIISTIAAVASVAVALYALAKGAHL